MYKNVYKITHKTANLLKPVVVIVGVVVVENPLKTSNKRQRRQTAARSNGAAAVTVAGRRETDVTTFICSISVQSVWRRKAYPRFAGSSAHRLLNGQCQIFLPQACGTFGSDGGASAELVCVGVHRSQGYPSPLELGPWAVDPHKPLMVPWKVEGYHTGLISRIVRFALALAVISLSPKVPYTPLTRQLEEMSGDPFAAPSTADSNGSPATLSLSTDSGGGANAVRPQTGGAFVAKAIAAPPPSSRRIHWWSLRDFRVGWRIPRDFRVGWK